MARSEISDCLLCGKELPVLRRLAGVHYCSKEHEAKFQEQQNQLAVEVLHRTHDALKAYRPTGSSIEDILGPAAAKRYAPETARAEVPPPVQPAAQAPPPAPMPVQDSSWLRPQAPPQVPVTPAPAFHFGESVGKLEVAAPNRFLAFVKQVYSLLFPSNASQRT